MNINWEKVYEYSHNGPLIQHLLTVDSEAQQQVRKVLHKAAYELLVLYHPDLGCIRQPHKLAAVLGVTEAWIKRRLHQYKKQYPQYWDRPSKYSEADLAGSLAVKSNLHHFQGKRAQLSQTSEAMKDGKFALRQGSNGETLTVIGKW